MNISIRRPSRRGSDSESDDDDGIIPPGEVYLTKINGKLVMARKKGTPTKATAKLTRLKSSTSSISLEKPRAAAVDFLGEAFGVRGRTVKMKRAKSAEQPAPIPLLVNGTPYAPASQQPFTPGLYGAAQQPFPYTTPLPQQCFVPQPQYAYQNPHQPAYQLSLPSPTLMGAPSIMSLKTSQEPRKYIPGPQFDRKATDEELADLARIDAHLRSLSGEKHQQNPSDTKKDNKSQEKVTTKTTTTITITKHICAKCRRVRSSAFHRKNPIKPGETPGPAYCRKCQRDASQTSSSSGPNSDDNDDGKRGSREKPGKGKSKRIKYNRKQLLKRYEDMQASASTDDNDSLYTAPTPKKPQKAQADKAQSKKGYQEKKYDIEPISEDEIITVIFSDEEPAGTKKGEKSQRDKAQPKKGYQRKKYDIDSIPEDEIITVLMDYSDEEPARTNKSKEKDRRATAEKSEGYQKRHDIEPISEDEFITVIEDVSDGRSVRTKKDQKQDHKKDRRTTAEEYSEVEGEYPDNGRGRRGRSTLRIEESEVSRRARSRSASIHPEFHTGKKPRRGQALRSRERSESISYRYVHPDIVHSYVRTSAPDPYAEEDTYYESRASSERRHHERQYRDQYETTSAESHDAYSREKSQYPNQHETMDDYSYYQKSWVNQDYSDDMTDPVKNPQGLKEHPVLRDMYGMPIVEPIITASEIEKRNASIRPDTFKIDDVSEWEAQHEYDKDSFLKHYHNNSRISTKPSARSSLRSLQRGSGLSNTNNTISRSCSRNRVPPPVPTPPSPFGSPSNSSHSSTCSNGSYSKRLAAARRGKKPQRDLSPIREEKKRKENWERTSSSQDHEKTSSSSHPYRPPFVLEATDGRTELTALVPSHTKPVLDDIDNVEKRAEEVAKRAVEIGKRAQHIETGAREMERRAEKSVEHGDYFGDVEKNVEAMVRRADDMVTRASEMERAAEEFAERGDYFRDMEETAEMEVERRVEEKHVTFNEKESVHSGTVWTPREGSTPG